MIALSCKDSNFFVPLQKVHEMKVTFTIEYNTCWGESLALVLNDVKYPMAWGEGGKWSVTLNVRAADLKEYGYVVMREGVIQRMEWSSHSSALPSRSPKTIADKWIDCPYPGCPFVRRHQVEKFDRPGFRGAGVVVPVFSLRTSDSTPPASAEREQPSPYSHCAPPTISE